MPPLVWHSHYGVRRQANAITRGGVGAVRRDSTDVMDTFIVPPRAQARGDLSTDGVSDTVHECGADGLSSFIGRGVPRSNTGNRRRCDAGQQSTGKRRVCPRQHATVRRRKRKPHRRVPAKSGSKEGLDGASEQGAERKQQKRDRFSARWRFDERQHGSSVLDSPPSVPRRQRGGHCSLHPH
jgi:hypothetical protein